MMNFRETILVTTGSLLLFVGFGAVISGIGLIMNSDGSNLGMTIDLLKDSPFSNFLIPGLFLLIINGFGSLIGSYFVFKNHALASKITAVLGVILVIWLLAQVYWMGWLNWLQVGFFVIALVEIILSYLIAKGNHANHGAVHLK